MSLEAYIFGIFPRCPELIDRYRKYERGMASEDELREAIRGCVKEIAKLQIENRLSYIHDPQVNWHDIFRPFTKLEGIKEGPLTRFFENNTFYRMPIVVDEAKYSPNVLDSYVNIDAMPAGYKYMISIPGPYTFIRLSYCKDLAVCEKSVKNIILGAVEDLANRGYNVINLHEPALAYYRDIDWYLVKRLYRALIDSKIEYRVHTYFGDVRDKVGKLSEIAPYGFSIDSAHTPIDEVDYLLTEKIILGIVDSLNVGLESPTELSSTIFKLVKRLNFERISLTTNADLDYLPYNSALYKVRILSHAFVGLRELMRR